MNNSVCRSSFYPLHNISSFQRVLDMKTAIIVQVLVIPRLDYYNSLLFGLPAILIKMLQRVQNTAVRVIAKLADGTRTISLAISRIPHNV